MLINDCSDYIDIAVFLLSLTPYKFASWQQKAYDIYVPTFLQKLENRTERENQVNNNMADLGSDLLLNRQTMKCTVAL